MTEKINNLKRRVKNSGFQIVHISGVINHPELNPFESYTKLRKGHQKGVIDLGDINESLRVKEKS